MTYCSTTTKIQSLVLVTMTTSNSKKRQLSSSVCSVLYSKKKKKKEFYKDFCLKQQSLSASIEKANFSYLGHFIQNFIHYYL